MGVRETMSRRGRRHDHTRAGRADRAYTEPAVRRSWSGEVAARSVRLAQVTGISAEQRTFVAAVVEHTHKLTDEAPVSQGCSRLILKRGRRGSTRMRALVGLRLQRWPTCRRAARLRHARRSATWPRGRGVRS
jgi:hypothetical protein